MKLDNYAMRLAFAERDLPAIKAGVEQHFNIKLPNVEAEVRDSYPYIDQLRVDAGYKSYVWDSRNGFSCFEIITPYTKPSITVWWAMAIRARAPV